MKALTLPVIGIMCLIGTGTILPPAFSEMSGIMIVNPHVQPSLIQVGDEFLIAATLVNNSTNAITVKNSCYGTFSVLFDAHAKVGLGRLCNWMPAQIMLQPGENITISSDLSHFGYVAMSPGAENATITFSYVVHNRTSNFSLENNVTNISKSFLFAISHPSGGYVPATYSLLSHFKFDIAANSVKCQQGFQLVVRAENNTPACVKSDTATKLVEWGWATMPAL